MDDERIERALRAGPVDEPTYERVGDVTGRRTRPHVRTRVNLDGVFAAASVAVALVVGLIALRPFVSTQPGPSAPNLLSDVMAAGRLRVAVTRNSPQLLVTGTGYSGFDLDVAQAIGDRLGVPVQVDLVDPATIENGPWNGRWDLTLDSAVSTDRRASLLEIGAPYYVRTAAIIVNEGSTIQHVRDLAGRSACVVGGGLADRWLASNLDLRGVANPSPPAGAVVVRMASAEDCLAALRGGSVEAVVVDWQFDVSAIPVGFRRLAEAPFTGLAAPAVDPGRAGSSRLLTEIDRIIAGLRADGTLRALSERRFGGQDLTALPPP